MKDRSKQPHASCQYWHHDLGSITIPDDRLAVPLRKRWWTLKRYVWYASILGFRGFASRMLSSKRSFRSAKRRKPTSSLRDRKGGTSNLKPGDWVEVRSSREIFVTLDTEGKLKGLRFTPEMTKFYGKRFRVYKNLDKILLETTGELRRIVTPTVLLDGVICDGSAHGGCDRSCFCFWREAWLKKVPPSSALTMTGRKAEI